MLQRIHQTFRVQLLRDVLLPRALDDQVLNTLSSMTFVNNTNVINWLACQQGDLVQALYVVALLCFAPTPVVATEFSGANVRGPGARSVLERPAGAADSHPRAIACGSHAR